MTNLHRTLTGAAAALLTASMGLAQEGPRLDYSLGLTLTANDNPDLLPSPPANPDLSADLSLGFALISETALSSLSFSGSGSLALAGDGTTGALIDPVLGLDWTYGTQNAGLSFSADHADSDLSADPAAADFGPGNRVTDSLSGEIALGLAAPFGATLSASAERTRYRDADPAFVNRRSADLGLDLRADFFQVWQANLGLSAGAFQTEGDARRDSFGATLGLTYLRPTSTWGLDIGLNDGPDGSRQSLSFSHSADLPAGSLTASLGAARGLSGQTDLTGAFGWAQEYAKGRLALDLSRALVSSDLTDAETLESTAALNWSQEVTARGALSLGLSYVDEAPSSGASTTTAQVFVGWSQDLGQDWALDLDLTHSLRESSGISAQSNVISLGLSRDFSLRF